MELQLQMMMRAYMHLINALVEAGVLTTKVKSIEDITCNYITAHSARNWYLTCNADNLSFNMKRNYINTETLLDSPTGLTLREVITKLSNRTEDPKAIKNIERYYNYFISRVDKVAEKRKAVDTHSKWREQYQSILITSNSKVL